MSEFNEKASTPPDTATDAGRAVFRIGFGWLKGDHIPIGTDLALASDLDAVSAERDALYDEATCAEEALEGGLVDFPDAPTDFDCLGKMADELVRQYRSRLDAVTAEREGWKLAYEKMKWIADVKRDKLTAVTAERDEAIESEKEESFIREKLARLLARSIIVLRGPEPKLTRWGYQDLPERVQELKDALAAKEQECERLREDAERWRRWLPWLRGLNRKPFGLAKEIHEIDAALATGGRHESK